MPEASVLERLPLAPAPTAVLTGDQVCAWLQISERQLHRLNLPTFPLGKRRRGYHVQTVLDELKRRAT